MDPKPILKVQKFTWSSDHFSIYCDIHKGHIRPYVPASLRREIMKLYHSYSHPSARVMDRLIGRQYIWPRREMFKRTAQRAERL